jgi:hypothetical protein
MGGRPGRRLWRHPGAGSKTTALLIPLATSRYQAADLIQRSGLVPVGISIGSPKFPLGYTPVYMKEAAPWGLREIADEDEFRKRYRARLHGIGIEVFQHRFAEISEAHDGRGLVFLCFEPVGAFCHRSLFGLWLEQQTGQHLPELRQGEAKLWLF